MEVIKNCFYNMGVVYRAKGEMEEEIRLGEKQLVADGYLTELPCWH
jgi:hypothetical protein